MLVFKVNLKFYNPTLQSLTGKYREIQGKPCNQNREPAMRTGFPYKESRFFPVGIDLQGKAVSCTGFGFTVHAIGKNKTKGILKFICVLELHSSSKERGNRDHKKCVKLNHCLK